MTERLANVLLTLAEKIEPPLRVDAKPAPPAGTIPFLRPGTPNAMPTARVYVRFKRIAVRALTLVECAQNGCRDYARAVAHVIEKSTGLDAASLHIRDRDRIVRTCNQLTIAEHGEEAIAAAIAYGEAALAKYLKE